MRECPPPRSDAPEPPAGDRPTRPTHPTRPEWIRAGLNGACGLLSLTLGTAAAVRVFTWSGSFLLAAAPPDGPLAVVAFTWFARAVLAFAPPLFVFVLVGVGFASAWALVASPGDEGLRPCRVRPRPRH